MTDTDLIFSKHNIEPTEMVDVVNEKYWYRCTICNKKGWVSKLQSLSQLSFYYDPCKQPKEVD